MSIEYYGSYYGNRNYEFAFCASKKTMSKKKTNASIIDKLYLFGSFKVMFSSNLDCKTFIINENIDRCSQLVKTVIYQAVGSVFEVNGIKMKLLKKNLYYSSKRSKYGKKYN